MTTVSAESFLEAVRAAPDDDAPRLIYADWLEERGERKDRAWATFIRSHVALARLADDDPARVEHEIRVEWLRREFSREWADELVRLGVRTWWFDRGLIAGFSIDAEPLLAHADELARLCPAWRELRLRRFGDSLAKVLALPHVERLHALSLVRQPLSIADARRLGAADSLGELRRLDLSECGLTGESLRALAPGRGLPRLVAIDLSEHEFATGDLVDFAVAPLAARLESIEVSHVYEQWAEVAAAASFPRLRELSVSHLDVHQFEGETLATTAMLSGVERLRLRAPIASPEGLAALVAGPALGRCEELTIDHARITTEHARELANGAGLPRLKRLRIADAPSLGSAGVAALAEARRWPLLESLDVTHCAVGDPAAFALAGWPGLTRLTRLDLSHNEIGDAGAEALARNATLEKLRELRLHRNKIGDPGAVALAHALARGEIHTLDLSRNPLGDPTAIALAGRDPRDFAALQRLGLGETRVGAAGANALAASESLRGLRELLLGDAPIPEDAAEELRESPRLAGLLLLHLTRGTVARVS